MLLDSSFNNHTITMFEIVTAVVIYSWKYRVMMSCGSHLGNYVWDSYSCRNIFLKVQGDDELRKSPDKPFHVLMTLWRTMTWECVAASNGILKSPIYLSWIWCLTSPWLSKSFSRYVPLIVIETLQARIPSCWLISLVRNSIGPDKLPSGAPDVTGALLL